MRFRRKPSYFEAEQYHPGRPLPRGAFPGGEHVRDARPYVVTARRKVVHLDGGEWVVPEPNGDGYYPVTAEIMPTIADPAPE